MEMNEKKMSLDAKDQEILAQIIEARESIDGPRVGDFVIFASGEIERIAHYHVTDEGRILQTVPDGSFYVSTSDLWPLSEFSGAPHPIIKADGLFQTEVCIVGDFWFFHHNVIEAGRGIDVEIPCRVFATDEEYKGYFPAPLISKAMESAWMRIRKQFAACMAA